MIVKLTLLIGAFAFFGFSEMDPKELYGEYVYEVRDLDFVPNYKSTLCLKKKHRFKREVFNRGTYDYKGNWHVEGSILYLNPDEPNFFPTDTVKVGDNYILFGEIGKHIKK